MTDENNIGKKDRRASRSILIASLGLVPAIAVLLVTLNYQSYIPKHLLVFSVFIFPVSFFCGFASGLVSPRKAIVRGPVWACIASLLLMTSLSGSIHDASITHSSWRVVWILGGFISACFSALVMEQSVQRGKMGSLLGVFTLACVALVASEFIVVNRAQNNFERNVIPQVVSDLNMDYVAVPDNTQWRCVRKPKLDSYELSALFNGERLSLLVNAGDCAISGINYSHKGYRNLSDKDESIKNYLKSFGFRDKLLVSLANGNGKKVFPMTASLNNVKLTITRNGTINLTTIQASDRDLSPRAEE